MNQTTARATLTQMLNVIFTRMEMQAMEAEIHKDESELVESCEVDDTIQSDDSNNIEVIDESVINDIVDELCDSAVQSLECETKTKEFAQDIIRSMSQVISSRPIKLIITLFIHDIFVGKFGHS